MNQCAENHQPVNVLAQRASNAPSGSRIKNPTEHSTACAIASFSNGVHGWLELLDGIGTGVVVFPVSPPEPEPVSITLVRSSESVPCPSCSTMRASAADEPGFVPLIA